jgi:hypothetical protein
MDSLVSFMLSPHFALAVDGGSALPLALIVAFSQPVSCGQEGVTCSTRRGGFVKITCALMLLAFLVISAV